MRLSHRLVIELLRPDGTPLGHAGVDPDWEPALEWARLAGFRLHGVWATGAAAERALTPLWHADLGEPFMRGFRVSLAAEAGPAWDADFPLRYFADLARQASTDLVASGRLAAGDSYAYRVLAYAEEATPSPEDFPPFATSDVPTPLRLHELSPEPLGQGAARHDDAEAEDFEVYIPDEVLDEASRLTARAGETETGGILIGHVCRDPIGGANGAAVSATPADGSEICVAITALVAARHTVSASTKLTFTSDTWTDVRHTVELRRRGEMVLGWFHSHPVFAWCRERGCPIERQRQCASASGFFSVDDIALHRTMFPRAFTVALLMSHSARGILPRLFGWRAGLVEPRGYTLTRLRLDDARC